MTKKEMREELYIALSEVRDAQEQLDCAERAIDRALDALEEEVREDQDSDLG